MERASNTRHHGSAGKEKCYWLIIITSKKQKLTKGCNEVKRKGKKCLT